MNKFIILVVVAAVLVDGYTAASLAVGNEEHEARIVKRDTSNPNLFGFPFPNVFPYLFAEATGQNSGNGHHYSSSYSTQSRTDANGKQVVSGIKVEDNDGKISKTTF